MSTKDRGMQILHKQLIDDGTFHSCLNCEYYGMYDAGPTDEEKEYFWCTKYQAFPPDQVLVLGCEDWCYNLPF